MTGLPRISVLVNNFNYALYLTACIDSVLAQDYPDFEVIVVDDGSTDTSAAIIESYGERIRAVMKQNGGQASCFNAGFAASSGEILCLLDADDTFLPGKLARLAEFFSDADINWCFDQVTTTKENAHLQKVRSQVIDKRQSVARGIFPSIPVPTSGLSFRRNTLAKILPMREAHDVVLSDNYMKFAAAFLGKGILVETPLTFQRLHDSNRYTGTTKAKMLKPHIMMATGLELAKRFPGLRTLGRQMVAGSLAESPTALWRLPAQLKTALRGSVFEAEPTLPLLVVVLCKRLKMLARRRA